MRVEINDVTFEWTPGECPQQTSEGADKTAEFLMAQFIRDAVLHHAELVTPQLVTVLAEVCCCAAFSLSSNRREQEEYARVAPHDRGGSGLHHSL